MQVSDELLKLVEDNEGYRQFTYSCTAGKSTIGIGFNLDDVGLSYEESRVILDMRLEKIENQLARALPWVMLTTFDDVRFDALCDMAYQLGVNGLLKFKKALAHLEAGDYESAAVELLDSRWAKQTPVRANKIALMIKSGEYA